MSEIVNKFSIQSYANNNRTKLDESLVSLRFMKEIDRFLDYKKISNKELALKLDYSESYISQLMSGIKNINTSFINKFEKNFSTKFDVKIYLKNETEYLHKLDEKNQFNITISLNVFVVNNQNFKFSYNQKNASMLDVVDAQYETI